MFSPEKLVRYAESLIQKISGLNCITVTATARIMIAAIFCGVVPHAIRRHTMRSVERAKWSAAIL